MSGKKYPPNDEWNGAERKCKYCNEEMPCSVKYQDQIHGGKALMDNCMSTRGMFHSLACKTFLNQADIESNRSKWVHNQTVWADEVERRKKDGLKYNAVEIKNTLVSQGKYYEMTTFVKRSANNIQPVLMPGGPVPKPVIDTGEEFRIKPDPFKKALEEQENLDSKKLFKAMEAAHSNLDEIRDFVDSVHKHLETIDRLLAKSK